MDKLHQEFKGEGLEVVALNFMEGPKPIKSFVNEHGFTFTVLLDQDGKISERYGVHALPVTVLIGRKGNLLARSIGYNAKETRQFIRSLLKDEGVIASRPKAEVQAGYWQGEGQRLLLLVGLALLGLLVVSTLWIRKTRFREK